jgi:hypothetical protein
MNELRDLLEMVDVPPTDPAADVARGERSLRRRRRTQVSAAVLSVAAVAALGMALGSSSGTLGAGPGYAGVTSGNTSASAHDRARAERQHVLRMEHRLARAAAHDPRKAYRRVLKDHLDPGGDRLGPVNDEEGGSGTYGTKLDWNHGGMLEIVLSHSWRGASHYYLLALAHMKETTYDGRPAQVSTAGDDLVVSVQHQDGTIVTLIASASFGNNGTTTSAIDLTQAQLLDAASDTALKLPPWVAPEIAP